jgi:small subunit ribosomal protein S17
MSDQPETVDAAAEAPVTPAPASTPAVAPAAAETVSERGNRKVRQGIVVSDKMEKTVVVQIAQSVRHRSYHKTIRRSRKLVAHDEKGEAHVGDTVRVMETRPLSKTKRWRVIEVLERAK